MIGLQRRDKRKRDKERKRRREREKEREIKWVSNGRERDID